MPGKAFCCPSCKEPFKVHTVRHPSPGLTRRYLRCENNKCPFYLDHKHRCRAEAVTEERYRSKWKQNKPPNSIPK